MLNKLKVDILNYLIKNNNAYIEEISFYFNLKNRMVYNYIDEINFILKKNKIKPLVIRKSQLECNLTDNDLNLLILNNDYSFSLNERIAFLCFDIIVFNNKNNIDDYSEILKVSKNTIINDFQKTKKLLKKYNLLISFSSKEKYKIIGDELKKRELLIRIIVDFILSHENIFLYKLLNINNYINEKALSEITRINNEIGKKLSNNYLKFLECYLSILIAYYKKNNFISIDSKDKNVLSKTIEYKYAKTFIKKIMGDFIIPEDETYYITILLTSGNVVNEYNHSIENADLLNEYISKFLHTIESNTYLFFYDKSSLIKDLYNHIVPTYYRIKFNLNTSKEYINLIKDKYSKFYEITKNNIYVLEEFFNINFNDNEISLITLYLVSYIISNGKNNEKIKTIIVTNEGINIYRILKNELEKIFSNIEIINIFDYDSFSKQNEKYDLILSSINLQNCDYVRINNILDDNDKKIIDQKIKSILKNKEKKTIHLSNVFNENHIKIFDNDFDDWKKAIKFSSQILLEENIITKKYIDAMINNIYKNSSVVTLLDEIVMPHATPQDGVNQMGFSFNVFKKPIIFPNEKKTKIKIIIILAPIDSQTHVTSMLELTEKLDNKEIINKIINSKSNKEIYKILLNKK